MKHVVPLALAAVVAAALMGGQAAQAQPYQPGPPAPGHGFRPGPPPPWGGPPRPGWRHWNRGDRFYGPHYVVHDWRRYALPPPWPGYYWARSGGEFVMLGGNRVVGQVYVSPAYP